ncbi:TetR/AcrR family transcriptional regulator [Ureibacillus manganicus]|uniref:TetR/AcrR family transcriptional regulator n=1 Tax=Ureibacillus manganicus TaxID=1266064 RepID=UPI00068A5F63|nr:TetR/AcrR family transcriptional regulator [Ureibacillus manganicus]
MKNWKEDRRIRRTKRNLKNTFIQLMMEKPYHSITVTDIVENADNNRTTFYRHYQDKEALVEDLVNEMLMKLRDAFRYPYKNAKFVQVDNLSPSKVAIFDYIFEHKNFYCLWKFSEGIPGFQNKFINTMILLHKEDISYSSDEVEDDFFITYRAYGVWGLIMNWIKNDFSPTSEEMAKQLINIINYQPLQVYHTKLVIDGVENRFNF